MNGRLLLLGIALQCVAARALASSDYPDTLKTALQLDQAPPCTLCHHSDLGGKGTITTGFGHALVMQYSVTGQNASSLLAAIKAEQADGFDSDCDGVPDMRELQIGRDPNKSDLDGRACAMGSVLPATSSTQYPALETGCSLSRGKTANSGAILAGIAVIATSLRRARKRAR